MTSNSSSNSNSRPLPKGKSGPVRTGKVDPAVLASDDFAAALASVVWEPPTADKGSKGSDKAPKVAIKWPQEIRDLALSFDPPMVLPEHYPSSKRATVPGQLASGPKGSDIEGGCLDRPIPQSRRGDHQLQLMLEIMHGRYNTLRFPAMSEGYRLPIKNLMLMLQKHPRLYKLNRWMQELHNSTETCVMGKMAKVAGRYIAMSDEFELYIVDSEA
jgi:hypothetical protein